MKYLGLVLLCCLVLRVSAQDDPLSLTFLGEQQIPTGEQFGKVEFGGISGLAYDAARDVYYAISDDRVMYGPERYYTLTLDIDTQGFNGVTINSMTEIRTMDDKSFTVHQADGEAIAYAPDSDTLFWASEIGKGGVPFIREMTLDGSFVRAFTLPDAYVPDLETHGTVDNEAFESLTLSADAQQIIVGTESPLLQDGPAATRKQGGLNRLLVFDVESGDVAAEYVYETGPIPHDGAGEATQDNGLAELLAWDDDTLLALERAYSVGWGNTISLYAVTLSDATNIASAESLADLEYTPVKKTLLLTIDEGDETLDIDNVEGMTLGPIIDGKQTLVFVSDNNFNPPSQPYTQFLVFLVDVTTENE